MMRPVNRPGWEARRQMPRVGMRWWAKCILAVCMLGVLTIVVGAVVQYKFVRPIQAILEPKKRTRFIDVDSAREARKAAFARTATLVDSLEPIEIRAAIITGLQGYEDVQVPFLSTKEAIAQLLGSPSSITPPPRRCAKPSKTMVHHYGINTIEVDSNGETMLRTIDLIANPNVKIIAGQYILSRATSIAGFTRRFPFSANRKLPYGYYGLRPVGRKPGERLHLTFDVQGRLALIEYYTSC